MRLSFNVSINGLGYVGRLLTRLIINNESKLPLHLTSINNTSSIENAAYAIKYNTNHGKIDANVQIDYKKNILIINGNKISYFNEDSPDKIPWKKENVELVFECTGKFLTRSDLFKHISSGARKVLLSAPTIDDSDADITVVYGINENNININQLILSSASCTTNAAATIIYPISKNYNIIYVDLTTIHGPTSEFTLMDNEKSDIRRSFALKDNLIPTTTSAAKTILRVLPKLEGKINSEAFYAPFRGASIMDFSFLIKGKIPISQIHEILFNFKNEKDVIDLVEDKIASTCLLSNKYSAIIDQNLSRTINLDDYTFIKLCAWFDHEYGFVSRMIDTAVTISSLK